MTVACRSCCSVVQGMLMVALAWAMGPALAWDLAGTRQVLVVTRDQQEIPIGSVNFSARNDGRIAFALKMDRDRFSDFFLSMKEFKCLEGPDEVACHVPYPYANPGTVQVNDFVWLEHSLLFLHKQPRDFGAKLWNGLYYRFQRDGEGLLGRPHAVDLNHISAPPADLNTPPYHVDAQDAVAPGARYLSSIRIR